MARSIRRANYGSSTWTSCGRRLARRARRAFPTAFVRCALPATPIQLWFRPHGMMQAYGGDPSGCLLTLSHRITQSARPLWHTAQTMSHTHARTRARMCARSQRSWPQVTSTCERRLAPRTSIVARAQGTRGKHSTTRPSTHTKHRPNPAEQTAHEQHQRGRCPCVLLSVGVAVSY